MRSWKERLLDEARARLNALQDRVTEFEKGGGLSGLAAEVAERIKREEDRIASGRHSLNPDYNAQVRLWYARLELEQGASADEVRASFYRLMRKYHPDRFTSDAESEALATRLSQELTVAYRGLTEHLGG
jgi:DnaJ-domain-containing protein 1